MMNINNIPQSEEVFYKAYVDKATCRNVQVWPVPEDLDNWHEVDFDESFDYSGKTYDPAACEWGATVESDEAYNERMLDERREAYIESDKLFMEWQYDQTPESKAAWVEAVAKVKRDFPFK
ncbi:hypothetical protein HC000_01955 [Pseudoalteromonas sp. MIP2626]|uniref:hypothetical protein n=1 Tax=Pseudoalteromonas sp. MIP2626 TaxID=2705464 RepID=UPI0015CAD077|nr:hypothetical protein [Pseudoalteromonas sp. MIP2626]NYR11263.1 hypothetical protein [Pseudoalteromonas sp. MIP2626]